MYWTYRSGSRDVSPYSEAPQNRTRPLELWWRVNEGWDGAKWRDKVKGVDADGTGHAPTLSTLNSIHSCLSFNGTQYLTLPSFAGTFFAGKDYTIAAAYRAKTTASATLLSVSDGSSSNYMSFYMNGDGIRHRHVDGGSVTTNIFTGNYGGYANSVVVFDNTADTADTYVNGEAVSSAAQTQNLAGLNTGAIGALLLGGVSTYFNGEIAEICVFDGKLTAADISALKEYFDERYDVWRNIEAHSKLAVALDPKRGTTIATGVSNWVDVVSSYTLAQATGGQQPVFNVQGSCASKAPSLGFTAASSQILSSSDAGLVAIANSDNYTMYSAFRVVSATTGNSVCAFSDSTDGTTQATLLINTTPTFRFRTDDGTAGVNVSTGTPADATDYWGYGGSGSTTDHFVRLRGASEATSATSINQSLIDEFVVGGDSGLTPSPYLDGEIYAILIFNQKLTTAEHSLVQASLDSLIGQ